jgi:two-component system sensor histidine kinase CiaH
MISVFKKRRLAFITIVYWFLLLYIIVALVWWFIALEKQNTDMFNYRVLELQKESAGYNTDYQKILQQRQRKTSQYIGEGSTFLLLILIGALFVYRAARKQLKLSKQQQNFMMAVTHELKTPIAVVNLNLETLQKRKLDEEKRQRLISATLQEADRLNILTTNILVTAQLESGNYLPDKENINLSELTDEVTADFLNRYQTRIIQKKISPGICVRGEKLLLQLLVSNLLDNALKYSPKQKAVCIELNEMGNKIFLKVIDEGSGIGDEEKKKVFDKFYRSGNEATRTTKGTGLGLYLCKRIAESHKAKINLTDNDAGGSIFAVELKASS